ncbi:MAG: phage/plasmid primase, P4 family [Bacillaceae bacterium]|nr:phage/plasmid primase, P4 family [Bacillaceae bacterium]
MNNYITNPVLNSIITAKKPFKELHVKDQIYQILRLFTSKLKHGNIVITSFKEDNFVRSDSFRVEHLKQAVKMALYQMQNQYQVKVGVGLRKNRLASNKAGTNDDISVMPALALDIKINGDKGVKDNLIIKEEVEIVLKNLIIKPTIINYTGDGLQLYFLLDKPFFIHSQRDKEYITILLERLERVFYTLLKDTGAVPKQEAEISSLLYLIGSLNQNLSPPQRVENLDFQNHSHSLTELEEKISSYESVLDLQTINQPVLQRSDKEDESEITEGKGFDYTKDFLEELSSKNPAELPLTELGNAERIVYYNQGKIKYTPEFGWLVWDGVRWVPDSRNQIEVITNKTLRKIYDEAELVISPNYRTDMLNWAKRSESRSVRINSLKDARVYVTVTSDELDQDPYKLNVLNGVIDLETGKLLPHDSDQLITKLAPVYFVPTATAPRFKQFLEEVFIHEDGTPDYELIRYMQKAMGYSLSGDTSEEVIFFLIGRGGNGKSKFIQAIQNIMGDYSRQTNTNTFIKKNNDNGINNDLARLAKARFVSAMESEEGQVLGETLVKHFSGGDIVSARFLWKEYFEFKPLGKIFLTSNFKPIIQGIDDGIWRRIKLIPFHAKFEGEKKRQQVVREIIS